MSRLIYVCTLFHVSGHLIHFEADLAFQNARQTFQGYFYSCQFPNTVYKKLVCYKCQMTSHKTSQVCGFGEEVKHVRTNLV